MDDDGRGWVSQRADRPRLCTTRLRQASSSGNSRQRLRVRVLTLARV